MDNTDLLEWLENLDEAELEYLVSLMGREPDHIDLTGSDSEESIIDLTDE